MDEQERLLEKGLELYKEGYSIAKIIKMIPIGRKRITPYLRKNGITIYPDGRRRVYNFDYFKAINTGEKAYWLGFLFADGCILDRYNKKTGKPKGMSMELMLKAGDKDHLAKFLIALDAPLDMIKDKQVKLNGKVFYANRILISSTQFCRHLIDKGMTPRKSLTVQFPSEDALPRIYLDFFLRGYFDGNGCILDINNCKHKMKYLQIDSGSRGFLLSILSIFSLQDKVPIRKKKDREAYCFGLTSSAFDRFFDYIYKDANLYLQSKYDKYIAVQDSNILNYERANSVNSVMRIPRKVRKLKISNLRRA
jgi:hypothetical protein